MLSTYHVKDPPKLFVISFDFHDNSLKYVSYSHFISEKMEADMAYLSY